jgi:hypothetical protein
VSIAGSGSVSARATETADISIVGSGDVTMAGGAKCTVSKWAPARPTAQPDALPFVNHCRAWSSP